MIELPDVMAVFVGFGAETREDRTKRLFRHYTVGSYDNFTSYRYGDLQLPHVRFISHFT